MKVYTYYENINFEYQNKVLEIWQKSWSKNGFDPVILNENDAKKSNLYEEYSNKIKQFPSVNSQGFDYHCFMRYLAVTCVEQDNLIISTEPDVINYFLVPDDIHQMKKDYLTQYSIVPTLHLGSKNDYIDFCKNIISHELKKEDNYFGKPHLSDQDFIARYNAIQRFYPNNYIAEVFEDGYLEKPVVHFGTPYMSQKGFLPKYLYIEKIRPMI